MDINDVKARANFLRAQIRDVGVDVKELKGNVAALGQTLGENDDVDLLEGIANVQLAYRHLEDARMRLGKMIQALEGGVSIFDRPSARPEVVG